MINSRENAKPVTFPHCGKLPFSHIDLKIIKGQLYNKGHGLMSGKSQSIGREQMTGSDLTSGLTTWTQVRVSVNLRCSLAKSENNDNINLKSIIMQKEPPIPYRIKSKIK